MNTMGLENLFKKINNLAEQFGICMIATHESIACLSYSCISLAIVSAFAFLDQTFLIGQEMQTIANR